MVRDDTNAYAIEMEGTQRSKSARREGGGSPSAFAGKEELVRYEMKNRGITT